MSEGPEREERDARGATRELLNCGARARIELAFACPMRWGDLARTADPRKRICSRCDREVYWCEDGFEASVRADQGECVALPSWVVGGVRADVEAGDDIRVGQPIRPSERIARVVRAGPPELEQE